MTEQKPTPANLPTVISNMENDIYDVRRWADVLIVMSGSDHAVMPEALSVLGNRLYDLGEALREQFKHAHALAHPRD